MKTQTFQFDKLVRDNIEQKLRDKDIVVKIVQPNTSQTMMHYFKAKLLEEATEVTNASTTAEIVEELADCLEVVNGFLTHLQVPAEELEQKRLKKLASHGGFERGTVVDTITMEAENPAMNYYLQNSAKYSRLSEDQASINS